MAEVVLERVVKRFGGVKAVDNVSLRIGSGEFFVLLGPSGCGKTTTLRIIAGLEYPDQGRVLIGGDDVTWKEPKDRDVAMVFQNYALYPHMKVFDNIAFPLRVRRRELGLTEEEIRKRVRETAELLRIEELLDRKPGQLSGGQQQRVALARALVRRPRVWLMDEPLSNLDALLRIAMRAELKNLQRKLGITTVYVTHDQAEAMGLADRIAVMNRGKVVQVGEPTQVYNEPQHTFVAGFLGSPPANLIECSLDMDGESLVLDCGGLVRRVTWGGHAGTGLPSKVIVAIRPEHVTILSEGASGGEARARVEVVEPLGSETITTLTLEGGEQLKAKTPGAPPAKPGDSVAVKVNWSLVSVFDADEGQRIDSLTRKVRGG